MRTFDDERILEQTISTERVYDGLILHIDRLTNRLPNGMLAAQRELREETGLSAGKWTHLNDLLTTVGFCDEKISVYLARELHRGESHPDDDEFLNLIRMPFSEALEMVFSGEIQDAKTITALLMTDALLRKERGQ